MYVLNFHMKIGKILKHNRIHFVYHVFRYFKDIQTYDKISTSLNLHVLPVFLNIVRILHLLHHLTVKHDKLQIYI